MAALQCEICGGKLMGKPGGIFECDSCGMEYSTEWAKAKIQEIRGTVQVEGTVEVKGTVKVEGSVNIDSLLKRARMALADKKWREAEKYYDEALNIDAERSECHLGLLCAQYEQPNVDSLLKNEYVRIRADRTFARALNLADEKTQHQAAELEQQFRANLSVKEAASDAKAQELDHLRAKIRPVQHSICCTDEMVVAISLDGTLLTSKQEHLDRLERVQCETLCEQLKKWENIVAVHADWHIVGLKTDGTVAVADSYSDSSMTKSVSKWSGIAAIATGTDRTLGLRKDGTVLAAGRLYEPDPLTKEITYDLSQWNNMAAVRCIFETNVGIRTDGTVVLGGRIKNTQEAQAISRWNNVVSVAACSTGWGAEDFIGLCADGSLWSRSRKIENLDILEIYQGKNAVYALDKDGNVLKVRWDGKTEKYLVGENVVALTQQKLDLICMKADGTLIRRTPHGIKHDFAGWKLFENIETIEAERKHCVEEKKRRIEEEKNVAYQTGSEILRNGHNERDLQYAIQLFEKLNLYRDAKEKLKQCRIRLGEVKKDSAYNSACARLKTDVPDEIRIAKKQFQNLRNWRDSADLAIKCTQKLENLHRRETLFNKRKMLENEHANLGIFSGKRKKEISAEIQKINVELARIEKELT